MRSCCTDALRLARDRCASVQTRRSERFRGALTCSSNRVMTAWTHSTGFCAAMAAHACTTAADEDEEDDDDEVEEERTPFPRSATPALLDPRRAALRSERGAARYSVWSVSETAACRHDSAGSLNPPIQRSSD